MRHSQSNFRQMFFFFVLVLWLKRLRRKVPAKLLTSQNCILPLLIDLMLLILVCSQFSRFRHISLVLLYFFSLIPLCLFFCISMFFPSVENGVDAMACTTIDSLPFCCDESHGIFLLSVVAFSSLLFRFNAVQAIYTVHAYSPDFLYLIFLASCLCAYKRGSMKRKMFDPKISYENVRPSTCILNTLENQV